ncbi:hypothetical protein BGZ63DRAFT_368300, partial [Mariannaea sp. PMI_226]
ILDNIFLNNNCLLNFYRDLDIKMGLVDVWARCMCYYGYILNFVVYAFLYGEDFKAFEAEL